jgi:MFS family permease
MPATMLDWVRRFNPFKTPEAQRLAVLFGVVYFSQGMWYLPNQTITIVLKDRGLSAGQVADFFLISTIPWLVKPAYGLLSDFVPLFGRRRKSYFLLTSALAAVAGLILASGVLISHGPIKTQAFGVILFDRTWATRLTLVAGVELFTLMALGLAFTDVLTDAMMVENGRPRGLTGAFQSVQWACITVASVLVGVAGGYLAETRSLRTGFALAACFPLVSMLMAAVYVREPRASFDGAAFRETCRAIGAALAERDMWVVAGFILFWTFSPSFGPAFLYYQTDTLGFSQQFIGTLGSLAAVAGVLGAAIYAPISRWYPLRTLINASIGAGVVATLAYLAYRGTVSALIIDVTFGCVGMITQLALLDLAAKSCPRRVEATFFALLMSVYNGGSQLSQNVGARLYDAYGYTPLVFVSAAFTAAAWLLVPLVKIDRIEARAREEAAAREAAAARVAAGAPA